MPLDCNVYATNAPIIATNLSQVRQYGLACKMPFLEVGVGRRDLQWLAEYEKHCRRALGTDVDAAYLNSDGTPIAPARAEAIDNLLLSSNFPFLAALVRASREGGWIVVNAAATPTNILREAVYRVWLRGHWDHHKDFRAWFIYPKFQVPLSDQFSLDRRAAVLQSRLRIEYSLSPQRTRATEDELAKIAEQRVTRRLAVFHANEHLPQALVAASVYLKYAPRCFDSEFKVRALINAVGRGQLYNTKEHRCHLHLLSDRYVVGLFELATDEAVFVALAEQAQLSAEDHDAIVRARDDDGRSAIDVAFAKKFKRGAAALRDAGVKTEVFDYDQLIHPEFRALLDVLLDPEKPIPMDPVKTIARVARNGQPTIAVLRCLFENRIDVSFGAFDYPLADACASESDDAVWVVADRMGATGVSPFTNEEWACYHLLRVLEQTGIDVDVESEIEANGTAVGTTAGATRRRQRMLPSTSVWLARKLMPMVVEHAKAFGKNYNIPIISLYNCQHYPDLVNGLLRLVDLDCVQDVQEYISFFIAADPQNPMVVPAIQRLFRELTENARRRAVSDGRACGDAAAASYPAEEAVLQLLVEMFRRGEATSLMIRTALDSNSYLGLLDYLYVSRDGTGDTLLHKVLLPPPILPHNASKVLSSILKCIDTPTEDASALNAGPGRAAADGRAQNILLPSTELVGYLLFRAGPGKAREMVNVPSKRSRLTPLQYLIVALASNYPTIRGSEEAETAYADVVRLLLSYGAKADAIEIALLRAVLQDSPAPEEPDDPTRPIIERVQTGPAIRVETRAIATMKKQATCAENPDSKFDRAPSMDSADTAVAGLQPDDTAELFALMCETGCYHVAAELLHTRYPIIDTIAMRLWYEGDANPLRSRPTPVPPSLILHYKREAVGGMLTRVLNQHYLPGFAARISAASVLTDDERKAYRESAGLALTDGPSDNQDTDSFILTGDARSCAAALEHQQYLDRVHNAASSSHGGQSAALVLTLDTRLSAFADIPNNTEGYVEDIERNVMINTDWSFFNKRAPTRVLCRIAEYLPPDPGNSRGPRAIFAKLCVSAYYAACLVGNK